MDFRSPARCAAILALTVTTLTGGIASHAAAQAAAPHDSIVVTTAWLAAHLDDPRVVILEVTHGRPAAQRIPGARTLPYAGIIEHRDGLRSELPPVEKLVALFESLGVGDSTRVVVYADEGPMAARAIFTLAYLGHDRSSFLDGGISLWRSEGRPLTRANPRPRPAKLTARPRADVLADAEWISARLGRPSLSLIDTRTDGEYRGTGNRSGMPSHGHLEGARQLEWETLFRDGAVHLRDRSELARMYGALVTPGSDVVTYCWVGYRASATWLVARWLGYEARMYDGSYQDWSQRDLPVVRPVAGQ